MKSIPWIVIRGGLLIRFVPEGENWSQFMEWIKQEERNKGCDWGQLLWSWELRKKGSEWVLDSRRHINLGGLFCKVGTLFFILCIGQGEDDWWEKEGKMCRMKTWKIGMDNLERERETSNVLRPGEGGERGVYKWGMESRQCHSWKPQLSQGGSRQRYLKISWRSVAEKSQRIERLD